MNPWVENHGVILQMSMKQGSTSGILPAFLANKKYTWKLTTGEEKRGKYLRFYYHLAFAKADLETYSGQRGNYAFTRVCIVLHFGEI